MVEVLSEEEVAVGHILASEGDMGVPDVVDDDWRNQKGLGIFGLQREEFAVEVFGTGKSCIVHTGITADVLHNFGQINFSEALLEGLVEHESLHMCDTFHWIHHKCDRLVTEPSPVCKGLYNFML